MYKDPAMLFSQHFEGSGGIHFVPVEKNREDNMATQLPLPPRAYVVPASEMVDFFNSKKPEDGTGKIWEANAIKNAPGSPTAMQQASAPTVMAPTYNSGQLQPGAGNQSLRTMAARFAPGSMA
jgi:hypothetical protein